MKILATLVGILLAGAAFLADQAMAAAGERSGEEIVKAKCIECHQTGKHGAPRIDDRAAWVPRLQKGLDATVRSAMQGHGDMPARGGRADLTDAEFRAAVTYLFNPAYPPPKPAEAAPLAPNQRIVDGTEIFLGVKPVKDGVYRVTVTLRDRKTHAVIRDAQVEASVTNPVMGGDSKKLGRETVDKTVSYGNDFRISGREPHVITVQVRRPGSSRILEGRFDFKS
jgi:cytochrome c5